METKKTLHKAVIELQYLMKEINNSEDEAQIIKMRNEAEQIMTEAEQILDIQQSSNNEKTELQKILSEKNKKKYDVGIEELSRKQHRLIEKNIDKSMIVAGCAGSGKSIIAMYKAQQLSKEGDVILIAYTKSLNKYMKQGMCDSDNSNYQFFYYDEWKKDKPKADYIIVDEIQDFTQNEIKDFIKAAKKCFLFFGDTAQSIFYKKDGDKTMTIEQISDLTEQIFGVKNKVKVSKLHENYRLPKSVAKITQNYLNLNEADGVEKYSESVYKSDENKLPHFIECNTDEDQINKINDLIKDYNDVGILVPDNKSVMKLVTAIGNAKCEYKYNNTDNARDNDEKSEERLDFNTSLPKIMTYHSAKGLQFGTVILPFYTEIQDNHKNDLKTLYVAMTRTYRNLYVLYNKPLAKPLSNIPKELYDKIIQ